METQSNVYPDAARTEGIAKIEKDTVKNEKSKVNIETITKRVLRRL